MQPRNLDPGLLLWNIRRRIATDRLPARRVVVQFDFSGVPVAYRGARKYWLVLERAGVDVCLSDPGYEVDVYVEANLAAIARVWLGDLTLAVAVRSNQIRLTGMPALVRQFPSWLLLSPFAAVPRPEAGRAASSGRSA